MTPDTNYEREPVLSDEDRKADIAHEQEALAKNPPPDPSVQGGDDEDIDPTESAESSDYTTGLNSLERAQESLDE